MLNIQENIPLAPLTTFKIGGPARYFIIVSSEEELIEALKWAKDKKIPLFILGGGSNLLISDKGFNGLVIKLQINNCEVKGNKIFAEAGTLLSKLVAESLKNSLTGLEWAVGIPGTVGGALVNNAGAFGKDISAIVEKAQVLDVDILKKKEITNKDCCFEYRQSMFKGNSSWIILSTVLNLSKGDSEKSREVIKENSKQRSYKQSQRSAGCFFKNISWDRKDINKEKLIKRFPELKKHTTTPRLGVGFLIDYMGLKGKSINDAAISYEHASYIINKGSAKAEDVLILVNLVKERIQHHYGLFLEEEVEIINPPS